MKQEFFIFPSPQLLAATSLLSVSINLATLDTSYEWNLTVFF